MQITETDKAWLAGVLETLGTVFVQPSKRAGSVGLVIHAAGNKHPAHARRKAAVRRSAAMLGVNIDEGKYGDWHKRQCKDHCPEPHVHIKAVSKLRWRITGARLAIVRHNCLPYWTADMAPVLSDFQPKLWIAQGGPRSHLSISLSMQSMGWSIPWSLEPPEVHCTECGGPTVPGSETGLCSRCYGRIWMRNKHQGARTQQTNRRRKAS